MSFHVDTDEWFALVREFDDGLRTEVVGLLRNRQLAEVAASFLADDAGGTYEGQRVSYFVKLVSGDVALGVLHREALKRPHERGPANRRRDARGTTKDSDQPRLTEQPDQQPDDDPII